MGSIGKTSVLGISAYYHDSSAALVIDGMLIAAAAEERFTRIKHDSSFPQHAVEYCLKRGSLAPQELDSVVFYEQPHTKFTRVLTSTLAGFPASRVQFASAMRSWLSQRLWTRNEISAVLNVHPNRVRMAGHHESHAAQAFLTAPFADAAILTVDAVGEWTCTALGRGLPDGSVEILETIPYPHSLGLVYSAFTAFLGFRPNDAEASTMALAAFGQPRFADQVREVLHVMEDGRYSVNVGFFNFLSADANMFTPAFAEKFGSPRDFKKELPFDSISDEYSGRVTCEDQRYADLAASLQVVLEDALLGLARRAKRLTESKNLCFAGGVALNAVANTRLIAESGFEDLFIPTDPGDGGASAGAALLEYRRLCDTPGPRFAASPFLGDEYPDEPLLNLAERLSPADWTPYLLEGCATGEDCTLRWTRFDSLEELAAEAASYLWAGRILGWIQGRFEFGPRALGNRSILVHPGRVDAVRRLSEKVKKRAQFRPYALAIREEDVLDVFDLPAHIPRAARWMQMVKRVRSEVEHLVRGAIHCNRTTRLQICSADDNPAFHCLLTAFREKYGIGALLNTSFNEPSYPIVSSPTEGMLTFARSEMDVLVAGQVMVTKI